MEAHPASDLDDDSLDLVERLMEQHDEFGIECSEDDWLNGSPVPRRPQPPTLPGGAEASPEPDDQLDAN